MLPPHVFATVEDVSVQTLTAIKAFMSRPVYGWPVMSKKVVVVDVREDIRSGREPFAKIMQAITRLEDDQDLLLKAPFEPAPLYGALGQRGFAHASKALPNGDWEVRFSRDGQPESETETASAGSGSHAPAQPISEDVLEVDARGLEPPQPLVKILEALSALPAGVELRAHTDRRPMHLYAQLEARGFEGETEEQPDGTFVTYVSRH